MPGSTICLTVLGRERPGIVAAITGVLYDKDCNIRDSIMTILAGEFAMLLVVELPEIMSAASLDQALVDVQRRFDLSILIKRLNEEELIYHLPLGSKAWAMTIYGGDRKGIIHQVALVLARKGISIAEMKTKVLGGIEGAGIASLKVIAPAEISLAEVQGQLHEVAARFGVEISIG